MVTIDSRGNHHGAVDGRFAERGRAGAAGSLGPEQDHETAKKSLDDLATYMALSEIDSELNEVAAHAVAERGMPNPGDQTATAFWTDYEPDAELGTSERALQNIGKFLGMQDPWERGGDNYAFLHAAVLEGGGEPDAFEEDAVDAQERVAAELKASLRRWEQDDNRGADVVRAAAGLLARQIVADYPDAAAVEVKNEHADDGEMWLQVQTVRDRDGIVIARNDDIWEGAQETAVSLDRDFDELGAMTKTALESRAAWGEEHPRGEDDSHFVLIDDAIRQTGPTL